MADTGSSGSHLGINTDEVKDKFNKMSTTKKIIYGILSILAIGLVLVGGFFLVKYIIGVLGKGKGAQAGPNTQQSGSQQDGGLGDLANIGVSVRSKKSTPLTASSKMTSDASEDTGRNQQNPTKPKRSRKHRHSPKSPSQTNLLGINDVRLLNVTTSLSEKQEESTK